MADTPGRERVAFAPFVDEIDLAVLKQAGVVSALALDARVVKTGELSRKVSVSGIGVTKGAKAAIEAAGGTVAE